MEIEVTDAGACKKNLVIELPAEEAAREFERISQRLAKVAKVPGFRPGRAPVNIIKRRFYQEIKSELIHDLLHKSYKQAIEQRQLEPISEPRLEKVEFDLGAPLRLELSFETLPEIEIEDYRGLEVKIEEQTVGEAEVDAELERLREQLAVFVPIEGRPVREGDLVSLDVEGSYVGGKAQVIVEKGRAYRVSRDELHEAFLENLVGMERGEQREFTASYPADHPDARLAGKSVVYKVKVVEIKEKQLPELNDELAKDAGDYASLDELRSAIRRQLEERNQRQSEKEAREKLLGILLERHRFEVPEKLVGEQLRGMMRQLAATMARHGIDPKQVNWNKVASEYLPLAEREVRSTLLLKHIARREGIEVSDEELEREFKRMAAESQLSVEEIEASQSGNDRMERLRERLRDKKALDFILENAKIIKG